MSAESSPAGIATIAVSLPPASLSLGSVLAAEQLTQQDIQTVRALGIDEVRTAEPGSAGGVESRAHDLAVQAALAALESAQLGPEAVDILVHIPSRVPNRLMTSEVTRVQQSLRADRATCLGVGDLGCTSSSAALLVAWSLLRAHDHWATALITHGSVAPTPRRYRAPVTVSGDAGVAVLLTRDARFAVLDINLRSDGRFWDLFSIDHLSRPWESWEEECASARDYSFTLAAASAKVLQRLTQELLTGCGIKLSEVRHVIMQNVSAGAYHFYEQALGHSIAPVCALNLRRYGHLGAADIFVNLASLQDQCKPGDHIMVLNNSPAAAWSAAMMKAL